MKPERILVVHTDHKTRGVSDPQIFAEHCMEMRTCARAPRPRDAEWLLRGMDVVFTVECWYGHEIPMRAQQAGIKTVVQGNPEMTGAGEMADVMLAPTKWRLDALPGNPVILPFPTDFELLPPRIRAERVATLYAVHSTAMCDRNGTELLLKACELVKRPFNLLIRGGDPHVEQRGDVSVHWLGHYDGMFYDHWPTGIDGFVIPRRFGGLCLPMQEAASLGLPIISLDVDPQRSWLPFQALVPAKPLKTEMMRGGEFEIYSCQPSSLASVLDRLIGEKAFADFLSDRALAWAEAYSWEALWDHYQAMFRE